VHRPRSAAGLSLEPVDDRVVLVRVERRSMHEQARRLVDDEDPRVLVQSRQRRRNWSG